jgi:hypothetical protein
MEEILRSINGIRSSSEKLRGCVLQSDLPFFLALIHSILYAEINKSQ